MIDEYLTGNKGMDDKIVKALAKQNLKFVPIHNSSHDGFYFDKGQKVEIKLDKHNAEQLKQLIAFDNTIRPGKYHVAAKEKRTYSDGFVFASKREMNRWHYLLQLQKAGEIRDLERQVPFVLQEGFISKQHGEIKPITYVADFKYTNISYRKEYVGRVIVEDSKGMRTHEYKLKRKMFLYKYGELLFFEV